MTMTVRVRKLRRTCWPWRRHKWRPVVRAGTDEVVAQWCDNCEQVKTP